MLFNNSFFDDFFKGFYSTPSYNVWKISYEGNPFEIKDKESKKDYKKEEFEKLSSDETYKVITVKETWLDENGCKCTMTSTKNLPNVSEKQLKISELTEKITKAVKEENYELASVLKKERDSIK